MDRVIALWRKCNRNRDKIRKIIGVVLSVLVVVLLVWIVVSIWAADKAKASGIEGISESPLIEDRNRDYGEAGLKKVAESEFLVLYTDITNGELAVEEKSSGKVWYSNPQDRAEDTYAPVKTRLESQIVVTYLDVANKKESTIDNNGACVKLGGLDYELIDKGIRFVYSFPKVGIQIPVEYTISNNGFSAEIQTDEIQEYLPEKFLLLKMDLLPYMSVGGLEDEGYLVVPDGSGALIHFNNGKQRLTQYKQTIYGNDGVVSSTMAGAKTEQVTMPVFGIKVNDNGLFGIVTSGEAHGEIVATTSRKLSAYNQIYTSAIYRDYKAAGGGTRKGNLSAKYLEYTGAFSAEAFRVEYYMLEDGQADYSAMALLYRNYLADRGLLKESELAKDYNFVLNLYGAVSMEKYVLGVEKRLVVPLTGYQDVIDIVQDLKARGIEKIVLNYKGAMDGGLNAKIVSEFRTESALGSKKDYERMKAYLEEEGVIFFIESDPINLYENGNGYHRNNDANLSFYDSPTKRYQYSLSRGNMEEGSQWYLLKPERVLQNVKDFCASASKSGLENCSLAELGGFLYSDYDQSNPVYRTKSISLWESALKTAAETFRYTMINVGNAYAFPYADVIVNVAAGDSGYDMVDESIPFYQMVISGNIVSCGAALNFTVDYHNQYLKALETGSSISYTWIAEDALSLVGTEYNDLVSSGYDYWVDTAVHQYTESKAVMELVSGCSIISHRKLAEDVYETTYDNGIRIYVNYSDEEYRCDDISVGARGFTYVQ